MRYITLLLIVSLLAVGLVGGCGSASDSKAPSNAAEVSKDSDANAAAICIKCGQIKGSDLCCKPGQELCSKCGLVKGAPGCCKIK